MKYDQKDYNVKRNCKKSYTNNK